MDPRPTSYHRRRGVSTAPAGAQRSPHKKMTRWRRVHGEMFERLPPPGASGLSPTRSPPKPKTAHGHRRRDRLWRSHQAMHEAMSTHAVGVDLDKVKKLPPMQFDKVRAHRSFVNIHGVNIELAEAKRQYHGDQDYHTKHMLRKMHRSRAEREAKVRLKSEVAQLELRLRKTERMLIEKLSSGSSTPEQERTLLQGAWRALPHIGS